VAGPARAPTRVLIADADAPTRAGVRQALERAGMVICAEVGDAAAAVEMARRERPEICLIGVQMPGNGISAAATISFELPQTPVVMLTDAPNDEELFAALRAGAVGYLQKETDSTRLPHALRGVLEGEAALSRTLAARVIGEFRERAQRRQLAVAKRPSVDLTNREWAVLELMRQGLSTAEIGRRLFISPVTVRTHIASVLRKLDVPDRQSAIALLEDG
jgi:DNA-binding NarL/FixJ family response regulator